MKKDLRGFLIVEEQGEGCDYTIGCGVAWYLWEAESFDALIADLRATLAKGYAGVYEESDGDGLAEAVVATHERRRNNIEIFEISASHKLDLPALRAIYEDAEARVEAADKAEAERAEFERLKAKFG